MNYMKDVAQLLGVELEEEFEIKGDAYPYHYKYKLTEECLKLSANGIEWYVASASATIVNLLNGQAKVVKIPKPVLDDIEKRYLKGVIRPFRDDVESICKCETFNGKKEYLTISFFNTVSDMYFPDYPIGTMYKDMVLNRKYSIEELGL